MLLAFSFIVIHCPCSGLLFFPTSIAVDTNPGCLWLLKPPPTHGWPLQFISGGRKVKRHLYFQTCPMQSLCKHILKHMNHFLLMSDISPVHPSSVTVTGYITIAFSRIRLPPCKCIQICLWLQVRWPKELKNLSPLCKWQPWSHIAFTAEPRTDLRSSKAIAWSCFSFVPTIQELLSLNNKGLRFPLFLVGSAVVTTTKTKTSFFLFFFCFVSKKSHQILYTKFQWKANA